MGSLRSLAHPTLFDIFLLKNEEGELWLCADWRTVPSEDLDYAHEWIREHAIRLEASYRTLRDVPLDYNDGCLLLWFSERTEWIVLGHLRGLRDEKGEKTVQKIRGMNERGERIIGKS